MDWNTNDYRNIKIEERNEDELKKLTGIEKNGEVKTISIYPEGSKVYNPAFDITPKKFITSLITNKGIINANKKDILKIKDD